ncbi:MAG: DUF362 domain-containing protein [Promethearchaeota archaeon]
MIKSKIAIVKENTPRDAINKGLELLGGISKFIEKDDSLFIKINLNYPLAYPANVNLETLRAIIEACIEFGIKKILVGSFPIKGFSWERMDSFFGYKELFEDLNVDFIDLSHSDNLKEISLENFEEPIKIPEEILNSSKLIIVNQVNVHPLFDFSSSILNLYSIISPEYQKIIKQEKKGKDYLFLDQYKKDLAKKILDVYEIKKPILVINDLFNLIEKAGPISFKNSKIKKTNIMILGNDSVAVDALTLKLFGLDPMNNELLFSAMERDLGNINVDKMEIVGLQLNENTLKIKSCDKDLENLKVHNTFLRKGRYCSGCYEKAFYLLNFMNTYLFKDLKYIKKQWFLIGENPDEPEDNTNVILFGDCACNTTKTYNFRKTVHLKKVVPIKARFLKLFKKKIEIKEITKEIIHDNKKILELQGCPPNFFDCLASLIKYYRKNNMPNLNFIQKTIELLTQQKEKNDNRGSFK